MFERALVTGGSGFVGSAVCIGLRQSGLARRVTALDNLHRRGSELNVRRLAAQGIEFVHGDIRCREDVQQFAGSAGLIVDCSAEPSAQAGYNGSPEYLLNTNLFGCFQCLELARLNHAAFIFLSTSRVYPYGSLNSLHFAEEETRFKLLPDQPLPGASERGVSEIFPLDGARSLYGMSKLASELMIQEYADAYGIPAVINRCGLLTGPWQMGKSDQGVIVLWMAAHYFGRSLRYIGFNGTGKQVRDLLHIQELVDLVIEQARNIDGYAGQVFNAGGGVSCSLSLSECTALCREITGNSVPISSVMENRPADPRIYISDCVRLSQWSGWRPRHSPRQILGEIFEWIQTEEETLRHVLLADSQPA